MPVRFTQRREGAKEEGFMGVSCIALVNCGCVTHFSYGFSNASRGPKLRSDIPG